MFKLHLKPSQEVPPIKGLKANAVGSVTFDLTRNASGRSRPARSIFSFNYSFPGLRDDHAASTSTRARRGANGGIDRRDLSAADSAHGCGRPRERHERRHRASAATLQAILDDPRDYYVNLHTTTPTHPGGAMREQLHNPKKR